ncbi:MAG: DUF4097 domain-containing protein [Clostridia bacterium]|nr:DUF4097 domain-containing protein [Clostridia bacterium]
MKGLVKCIIAGVVIIVIGVVLLIVGLSQSGWSFEPDVEFTTETYTAEHDNTAIDIEIDAGVLKTQFYDGDKIYVEYPVAKNFRTNVYEKNGTLFFETGYRKFFYVWGTPKFPETVIKLPRNVVFDVELDINAGTVHLEEGKFGKVELEMSAGTLNCGGIDCSSLKLHISAGSMSVGTVSCNALDLHMSAGSAKIEKINCADSKIKVSAGSIKLGYTGDRNEYRILTDISAGSCNVSSQEGTTNKKIDIDVSAGSVKLEFGV